MALSLKGLFRRQNLAASVLALSRDALPTSHRLAKEIGLPLLVTELSQRII